MNSAQKQDLIKKTWGQVQKEFKKVINNNHIQEIQSLVKKFLNKAQNDYLKMAKGDLKLNIKTVKKELKQIEKSIDQLIQAEIKKAKSFLQSQKKELSRFQKKLETSLKGKGLKVGPIKASIKTSAKRPVRTTKKKATTKKH